MPTTPLRVAVKDLRREIRANSFVSKLSARKLRECLTRSYPTTNDLLTALLGVVGDEEQAIQNARNRAKLKHTLAAIWECARYGWACQAFRGRTPKIQLHLRCRRTRALAELAVRTGASIAQHQALEI